MKHVVLCVLAALAATPPGRVDVGGRWTLKMDRDFRGNPGRAVECIFNQQGERLTVTCGKTGAELEGRLSGRIATWGIEKTGIPPMVEDRLVLKYSGELNASGNTLTGTWRLTSGVLDEKGTFQARRTRSAR